MEDFLAERADMVGARTRPDRTEPAPASPPRRTSRDAGRRARLRSCDPSPAHKGRASTATTIGWALSVDPAVVATTRALGGAPDRTARIERMRLGLAGYRRLPDGCALGLSLRPMRPDASDATDLRAKAALGREFPPRELSFYHNGLAPLGTQGWSREALARHAHDDFGTSRGSAPASRG